MARRLTITIVNWVPKRQAEFIIEFAQTFGMTHKESGDQRTFSIVVDPAQLDAWEKHLAVWKEDGSVACSDATKPHAPHGRARRGAPDQPAGRARR